MMEIEISAEHEYSVVMCPDWKQELKDSIGGRRAVIVTTESVQSLELFNDCNLPIINVPDGEVQKTFDSLSAVVEDLARTGLTRGDLLIGIGGGATTDLTGFAASIYLRGISWIAIPTTVAGMVDAAIGGKTGINLRAGKNLVGTFHSPDRVIVDLDWLKTLSRRDWAAGLAESAKCGFIVDPEINRLILNNAQGHMEEIIFRSIQVKARVVSNDFKESGLREILNYGHTLGHAIEHHSNFHLRHGEAVGLGLIFAAELSHRLSNLSVEERDLHRTVIESLGLPSSYPEEAWPILVEGMKQDKKRRESSLRFVSLEAIGKPTRLTVENIDELRDVYEEALGGTL